MLLPSLLTAHVTKEFGYEFQGRLYSIERIVLEWEIPRHDIPFKNTFRLYAEVDLPQVLTCSISFWYFVGRAISL